MLVGFFALLGVKIWAFVDALSRPPAAYVAADKLTKPAWSLILGLTVASSLVWSSPLGHLDAEHHRHVAGPRVGHPTPLSGFLSRRAAPARP